jgi:hypothetical protein
MKANQLMALAAGLLKYDIVISSNMYNFNLYNELIARNWPAGAPATVNVTINTGVYIGSTSTSTYSFDTGTGFTSPMNITITNNGYILGRGGDGSSAVHTPNGGNHCWYVPDAGIGGSALRAQTTIKLYNNGTIGGGGGGGGHGESNNIGILGGGGGGGAGYPAGVGASGLSGGVGIGGAGSSGTLTTGGAGAVTYGGTLGGSGGNLGFAGGAGAVDVGYTGNGCGAGAGGAAGAAVVGNSNITWMVNGTILGSIT